MRNSIIRQMKIDLITDTHNPIIEWFNNIWSNLDVIETDVCHRKGGEIIYYKTVNGTKKTIFFRDDKNRFFVASHELYWQHLDSFNMDYQMNKKITKFLVESKLNEEISLPWSSISERLDTVNKQINK